MPSWDLLKQNILNSWFVQAQRQEQCWVSPYLLKSLTCQEILHRKNIVSLSVVHQYGNTKKFSLKNSLVGYLQLNLHFGMKTGPVKPGMMPSLVINQCLLVVFNRMNVCQFVGSAKCLRMKIRSCSGFNIDILPIVILSVSVGKWCHCDVFFLHCL